MSPESRPRLHLRVITSEKLLVDAEVEEIALPGLEGEVGILPGHRPLILALGSGSLRYRRGERVDSLFIKGGYATISGSEVLVFSELDEDDRYRLAEKQR